MEKNNNKNDNNKININNNINTIITRISVVFIIIVLGYGVFQFKSICYPSPKKAGKGEVVISCVGDSITYGLGVYYNRNLSWVSLLPKKLGDNYKTINYGISDRTLLSTGNFPYLNEGIAKKFLNSNEDIIIFMLGTNDSKKCNWNQELFEKEYKEFLNLLSSKNNNPKVYAMIPPKLFLEDPEDNNPNYQNLEEGVIPTIESVIKDTEGIEVIDLYSLTKDHSEWFNDGIHPNDDGNEAIANEIAKVIKETY